MAVETIAAMHHRYIPRETGMEIAGLWTAIARGIGDGGGGNMDLKVIPNSPFNRIYRIDAVHSFWVNGSAVAANTDELFFFDINKEATSQLFERASSDGTTSGTNVFTLHNPLFWNSANKDEVMLQHRSLVTAAQDFTIRASGVFYEPVVTNRNVDFAPGNIGSRLGGGSREGGYWQAL